ncbi:NUDIX hydrolase [Jiangella alba]|uniref:ADP-ribose pyrophosphatase YjhB, NUDIX family n=1 Tax=Jiangella alba TaxID=561176 RepID=A0A1H5IAQ5_9ACTN|nr:NUDIX domain-containing protein [Jiangella alba]SEE37270.1 ADP-ribose pyrophosphatase YjhB, NUDIX family [Jiangella alba]
MTLFPRLRVSAYVICADGDGRLLLSRWIGYEDGPQWSLAGGGLDPVEDPRQGALREVFEETGYVVELDALLGVDTEHFVSHRHVPGGYDGVDVHAVRIVYRGHVVGGELTHEVGGTSDLAAWLTREELAAEPAVSLVKAGLTLYDDGDGVPVAPHEPRPALPGGVRVEQRVAAYGTGPDGDTAGALLVHGADPADAVRAEFRTQHGRDVTVGRPRDASSSVEPLGDDAVRWTVRLDYDVS